MFILSWQVHPEPQGTRGVNGTPSHSPTATRKQRSSLRHEPASWMKLGGGAASLPSGEGPGRDGTAEEVGRAELRTEDGGTSVLWAGVVRGEGPAPDAPADGVGRAELATADGGGGVGAGVVMGASVAGGRVGAAVGAAVAPAVGP
jgi:hypothetical protein